MKNLQEATERICELKGSLVALDALVPAVIDALSEPARARLIASFDAHAEAARTVMLHADISDVVLATFERDVARDRAILVSAQGDAGTAARAPAVDGLLLATTCITPFAGTRALPRASGFFFRRGERLFLVSDRHVFRDDAGSHRPDRVEIGLHTNVQDLTRLARLSLPLHRAGRAQWREAPGASEDGGLAVLEIPAASLPSDTAPPAFDASHLEPRGEEVSIGDSLTIVSFATGFDDTLHHLPVARGAGLASAFGIRYRGQDCFVAETRARPGAAGSPVVRRRLQERSSTSSPSWQLLGVLSSGAPPQHHAAGPDGSPEFVRAWYAEALRSLTADD